VKSQPSRSRTRPGDGDRTPIPEPDSPAGVPKAHARRRVDSPVPGRERETEEPARACLGLLFAGKFFFFWSARGRRTMCRVRRPVVAFVLAIDGASFAAAANEIFKTKKKAIN
jgi:hypothetical protein